MPTTRLPLEKTLRGHLVKSDNAYLIQHRDSKGAIQVTDLNSWLQPYEGRLVKLTVGLTIAG